MKLNGTEAMIVKCLKDNIIDTSLYERLAPSGTHVPRLYGLPKVHKPGVPLRPIIDMCSSPYHAVAQWLSELLEPVREDIAKYSLRDTFDFIQRIREMSIADKPMVFLDVQSHFTNVPLIERFDISCDQITSNGINL